MEASTPIPEPENQLSAFITNIPNEVQLMVENMLKKINEIKEHSDAIKEEIEKCKDSALQRKRTLDEDKDQFQKVASAVLDMLTKNECQAI
ncbi:uncharacterized protein LOC129294121 [Prosopis cineraria]|uniref:uncharacterized protein LOC129294121 n=1 Tax=Prosopis cineraria TaxID=364024 RepID=UPI00240ECBC1|nr:uncharacterized protein LOC129294121 [Prosopis cineraria]